MTEKQRLNEPLFVNEVQKLFDIAHAETESFLKVQKDKDHKTKGVIGK